ncbi:hypothetical protein Scep_012428 [Stephania cephalantha]|uniref:Uncharacterized protein n=1 Tax=Stephania cephalantha TaxID=152367 RepID=A0AAP0JH34_9MAGN
MQTGGKCWRQHKSKITSDVLEDNKKQDRAKAISNVRPPNVLSDNEWDDFVKERLSPSFQSPKHSHFALAKLAVDVPLYDEDDHLDDQDECR